MDHRKHYVAPAIAVEDVLEQTSLACMVTEPYPGKTEQNGIFATGLACGTRVNKGGVFIAGETAAQAICTIQAPKPSDLVVLS